MLGLFHSPEHSWGIHAWIELPTGEWIDPTSAASGLPECLVLTRDDDRREFYHGVMPKDHERAMENAQDIGVPVRVMLAERIGE